MPKQAGDSLGAGFTYWEGDDEWNFWAVFPTTSIGDFYFCFAMREKKNPLAPLIPFDPKIRNQGPIGSDFMRYEVSLPRPKVGIQP